MPLGYTLALLAMAVIASWAICRDLRLWMRIRWRPSKRRTRTTQEKPRCRL